MNIGDTVYYRGNNNDRLRGRYGTIVSVDGSGTNIVYNIRWSDVLTMWMGRNELSLHVQNSHNFKVGDKVKLVSDILSSYLLINKLYKVTAVNKDYLAFVCTHPDDDVASGRRCNWPYRWFTLACNDKAEYICKSPKNKPLT